MKPNTATIQEIKTKLDEAEAELARVRSVKSTLKSDLGSDTFQKLEQSRAKAEAEYEKRRDEFLGAAISQYLSEQMAKLENKLPEGNLEAWQKALDTYHALKGLNLPFLTQANSGVVEQATEIVKKRLLVRVLEDLPKHLREELGRLLKQEDMEPVAQFMRENKPEFGMWVVEETGQIKKELAELIG